jgi:nicotinamidase/pyrazinamidase
MGTTLFLIDPQNDFADQHGALSVRGGEESMYAIMDILEYSPDKIDRIVITLDEHPINHIAHAVMWLNSHGHHPNEFSQVCYADAQAGKWFAALRENEATQIDYLRAVEEAGEVLTIWPQHCLTGSWGAAVHDMLWDSLMKWWKPGKELLVFSKSGAWQSEQYSSFQCLVPVADDPTTGINWKLRDAIIDDQIYVGGLALSHCVAATLRDAINLTPDIDLASRITLLLDCTSPVQGFEKQGQNFVDEFVAKGGKVGNAAEIFQDYNCEQGP